VAARFFSGIPHPHLLGVCRPDHFGIETLKQPLGRIAGCLANGRQDMARRRKRRSKNEARRKRGAALFAGVAIIMLIVITAVLVPSARRKNISTPHAIELSLLLWACSLFAAWACLHSRRKRRKSEQQFSTYTDYSESVHGDLGNGSQPRNEI
jgi:hypothetical protein